MEAENVNYYDSTSARPLLVRVLVLAGAIELYDPATDARTGCFALTGMSHNQIGDAHYIYLEPKGLQYLQFHASHPLATLLPKQIAVANRGWGQTLLKQKGIVLITLMLVLSTGLYFALISLVPFIGSRMIGVAQEVKMGDKLREVMLQEAALAGAEVDTAGTRTLQAFADKLQLSRQYPIRVTLVKSAVVNAYALPGGQVVVYSGILEKIETPEALAALLAHESSHVNERHSLKALLRNAANAMLIAVVFNDATGISGALVSNANALNGLRYSRSAERDADTKGMDLLLANNTNIEGMRTLMQTLEKEGGLPSNLSFLSTHPLTKERIRAATDYIRSHPQQVSKRDDLEQLFRALK